MCARERYDTIFVFLDILRRPPLKYVEILYFFSYLFHSFFYDTLLNDDDYDDANVLSVRYLSVCLSVSIIKSSYSQITSSAKPATGYLYPEPNDDDDDDADDAQS